MLRAEPKPTFGGQRFVLYCILAPYHFDVKETLIAQLTHIQAAESASQTATAKYDALAREHQDAEARLANEKLELERKLRVCREENGGLREEVDEVRSDLASESRQHQHRISELETRNAALERAVEEPRAEVESKTVAIAELQRRVAGRDAEVSRLESDVTRLRALAGDVDGLALVKRELSEQVAHIRKLEVTNREQAAELKRYRKQLKSVEIVEEEKMALQGKLRLMDNLRSELAEAKLRAQVLEEERGSWASYLEGQAGSDGPLRFDSPEELARAFIRESLERASLMEKLGSLQPELAVREDSIRALEDEKAKLAAEMSKLRISAGDNKQKMRLERQRALAVKEVEYLRAQLRTFDTEESEFQSEKFDAQKTKRINELEDLVDGYRTELHALHADLTCAEDQRAEQTPTGSKRPHEAIDDDAATTERVGELRRKNRAMQEEISAAQTRTSVLEAELRAQASQLSTLKTSSRTRILELRTNPTATAAAIKQSTLTALRDENRALLARLEGQDPASVPRATLAAARAETEELRRAVADREKRMLRLKQIWAAKALEFREAVASILGWKMDFMPNGRVRVSSVFYDGNGGDGDEDDDDDEHANSIVFDGENGTMKVSGGPQSAFAREIKDLIAFWVEGRKEVPCFLAAMTLEFYDRTTRAARA